MLSTRQGAWAQAEDEAGTLRGVPLAACLRILLASMPKNLACQLVYRIASEGQSVQGDHWPYIRNTEPTSGGSQGSWQIQGGCFQRRGGFPRRSARRISARRSPPRTSPSASALSATCTPCVQP